MKPNAILQSNLLDIIFENRNKDYGAYLLRKNYNKRLTTAVFITLSIVIVLTFFLTIIFKPDLQKETRIIKVYMPLELSKYKQDFINISKKIKKVMPGIKLHTSVNAPPVITAGKNINKPIAADKIELPSNSITSGGISFQGDVSGSNIESLNKLPPPVIIEKDKLIPVESPEIMPQYPGGIKALLAFLKNNIHAPEELNDDEVVTVKIKFVINYDGKIESFQVLQSGGEIFDNEVIRVLKKMPLWIPGKSKGENVSVYYYLPVKFTAGL